LFIFKFYGSQLVCLKNEMVYNGIYFQAGWYFLLLTALSYCCRAVTFGWCNCSFL